MSAEALTVVMFDLGDTLVDRDRRPFPYVTDALRAVGRLQTATGEPLRYCLVSDFEPAEPPTPSGIAARFAEYLAILDHAGLRSFFEPVEKRVTLSTHAGAEKPSRLIFTTALQRLGVEAALDQCLLVTENAEHVRSVRQALHMKALQFRSDDAGSADFDDWRDAPALIAALVATDDPGNAQAALQAKLAGDDLEVVSIEPAGAGGAMQFAGRRWHSISVPGHAELRSFGVAVPVVGHVARGPRGEMRPEIEPPPEDALAEAISYVQSLADRGQIGGQAGRHVPRPTHEIVTDEQGTRRLIRKRVAGR